MAASSYSTTTTAPEITKHVRRNRQNRDYDCFVAFDGEAEQYIGSTPTYDEGLAKCDTFALDYYSDNHTPEKAAKIAMDVYVSPDAGTGETLGYTPRVTAQGGALTVRMGRLNDDEWQADPSARKTNPRQRVREVVHLETCPLVVVVGETELFVMTSAEFAAQA